jgi:hypothetical protein
MIKLTVLYPNTDLKFDKEYYVNKHGQLLTDLLGDAIISSDKWELLVVLRYTGAYVVIANMVLNLWSRLNILLAPMPKRLWPIFQISRMFSHKFKLVSFID